MQSRVGAPRMCVCVCVRITTCSATRIGEVVYISWLMHVIIRRLQCIVVYILWYVMIMWLRYGLYV